MVAGDGEDLRGEERDEAMGVALSSVFIFIFLLCLVASVEAAVGAL